MSKNTKELSFSEIQKIINENNDFDAEVAKIKKQWGGELEKSQDAKLSPEDIFDIADAGEAAERDIEAEFGEDEFSPMSDDEYKNIMNDLSEDEEVSIRQKGLFKPKDSEGNDINIGSLVKPVDNEFDKKGRVSGLGDDGKGSQTIIVDYQWPLDLKYMAPKEMGKTIEYPQDIIVQLKTNKMNELNNDINNQNPNDLRADGVIIGVEDILQDYKSGIISNTQELQNIINNYFENLNTNPEQEERKQYTDSMQSKYPDMYQDGIEEMRSLGKGVKNSGDRNVKQREDKHSAPTTNINESIDRGIKTLMENKVTKNGLKEFISEEAKKVAKNLRG